MNFSEFQDYIQLILNKELNLANENEKRRKTMMVGDWVLYGGNVHRILEIVGNMVETREGKKINVKYLRKYLY